MSRELQELAAEIASLAEKLSGLGYGSRMYTASMAQELTKEEYFIGLAFQSLMTYAYPGKSINEICAIAIEAGTELAKRIEA